MNVELFEEVDKHPSKEVPQAVDASITLLV
jgi:hypothetical protein